MWKKCWHHYDVMMTSSKVGFLELFFAKMPLIRGQFTPWRSQDSSILSTTMSKDNRLSFLKITRNLILPLRNMAQLRHEVVAFSKLCIWKWRKQGDPNLWPKAAPTLMELDLYSEVFKLWLYLKLCGYIVWLYCVAILCGYI